MDSAVAMGTAEGTYTCEFQGISPGWSDVYDRDLDCQWLDVTGVPAGEYVLRLRVNPELEFEEANYRNNVAEVRVRLPAEGAAPGGSG